MSQVPADLFYTDQHEWVRFDGEYALVGITDYAQESLGDITFVEFPNVGDVFAAAEAFGVVESVKAASDLYLPLGGEVLEVNEEVDTAPELLNQDPYEAGWLIKIKVSDLAERSNLLTPEAYSQLI